uniref:Uncharacterized protein n=1 Tax=Manihot esculenta TaxID=3983 RepID=A0A2C9WDQ3_MANES
MNHVCSWPKCGVHCKHKAAVFLLMHCDFSLPILFVDERICIRLSWNSTGKGSDENVRFQIMMQTNAQFWAHIPFSWRTGSIVILKW